MNLQISVPYQTCPYNCPFCIAKNPATLGKFDNLYERNKEFYFYALRYNVTSTFINNDYKPITCVITGCTEPTLNLVWLKEVLEFLRNDLSPRIGAIEIQTSNMNFLNNTELVDMLDVVAVSIYNDKQFENLFNIVGSQRLHNAIIRPTLILNNKLVEDIKVDTPLTFIPFKQVTFKVLQPCKDETVNNWIEGNKDFDYAYVDYLVAFLTDMGVSVFYDKDCMDTKDGSRYMIFREDGNLYKDWNDTPIGKENV